VPAGAEKRGRLRILVGQNQQDERELIGLQLAPLDHIVDFADNGASVVKQYRSQSYDLVIVEVELPVMDGVSVARTIRSWELLQEFEPTPIIALTTLSSEIASLSDLVREFTDYLVKPVGQDQLLDLIRCHARDI
jgi:CheY-like chemotaxis protein